MGGRDGRRPIEYDIALDLEAALGGKVERVTVPGDEARTLEVRIPAGVSDGTRLTAGDLHLRVRLKPHPRFERQGRDLTTQAMVSMSTAVLGGTVDVVTLSGSRLTLKVPAGTQPGQRLRVKGHGLPAPGAPDDRGDLYVAVAGPHTDDVDRRGARALRGAAPPQEPGPGRLNDLDDAQGTARR